MGAVAGGGTVIGAAGRRGDGGVELVEQRGVQRGGVFGVHPPGVGVGQRLVQGPLLVVAAAAGRRVRRRRRVRRVHRPRPGWLFQLAQVAVGGVAAGAQSGDVSVLGQLSTQGPVVGEVVEVQAGEVLFGEAVGVVGGVGWRLAQVLLEPVVAGGEQVELVADRLCVLGVGGVRYVGVEGGGVVGEQLDAVGQQARVLVGAQRLFGVDVVQVFRGGGEQISRGPVTGGHRGDQGRPGVVGEDRFGDDGAEQTV